MTGMFSALAYALTCLGNLIPIKVAGFLDYDPKDIIIVIAGFIVGPIPTIIISTITALLELITISTTGPIGFLMNIISSCAFALPASVIYHKKRTFSGAVIGLCTGVVSMAVTMVLWNYLITPLYMGIDRSVVAGMLATVFLPFNLIKGALNASLAMLLYKPVVKAMRGARLLDSSEGKKGNVKVLLIVVCVLLVSACVLGLLVMGGII
ncbi:MAG: ECF transporter S component [Ruminococcaceae bacterium]|nr:ECF transporter S component [Oscillospiraceae bacterium]